MPTKAQEALRVKAVKAVRGGMTQVAAAETFGVTRQAVGKWMRAYREGGMEALTAKPQGRPKTGGRLVGWQAATIVNLVTDHHPEQLKLLFVLWTREAVRTLIRRKFGIRLSLTTIGRYLAFMAFKKRFRAAVFLQFLRRLVKQAQRKVFLVVDRHPVHRGQKVRQWLKKNAAYIRLFLLLGYSPELNPDEMLNQDVKTNAVGRKRPRNQLQLMRNVPRYLERRRANPALVKRYFHQPSVRYAAT